MKKEFFAILLKEEDNKVAILEMEENGKVFWLSADIPWNSDIGDIVFVLTMGECQDGSKFGHLNATEFCMVCETLQIQNQCRCSGFSKTISCRCKSCGFEWDTNASCGTTYTINGEKIKTSGGYYHKGNDDFTEDENKVLGLINSERKVRNLQPISELIHITSAKDLMILNTDKKEINASDNLLQ